VDQPRELKHYFEELENLSSQAGITVEQEKKKQVVRYLDVNTTDMWKSMPSYASSSYEDWVKVVTALYPEVDQDR
jgi:hypothetical protein